jgi:hypothetical protein
MNLTQITRWVAIPALLALTMLSCSDRQLDKELIITNISSSRGIKKTASYKQVLRILLEKALSDERMPMKKELTSNHYIKDSILLCIDMPEGAEPLDMPIVGDYKFKMMSKEALCQLLIERGGQAAPPYLYVHSISNSSGTIKLKIDNTCMAVVNVSSNTDACDYLSHCGGGMEIHFYNHNGSLWEGEIVDTWVR